MAVTTPALHLWWYT